jgi:hypothetical protein
MEAEITEECKLLITAKNSTERFALIAWAKKIESDNQISSNIIFDIDSYPGYEEPKVKV